MNPGSVFRPGGPPVDPWVRTGLVFGDFLTALVTTGIDGAEGRRLGPYPHRAAPIFGGARQTPWEPPVVAPVSPARRAAMTEGVGMPALVALVPPPGPRPRLDLTGAQSALEVTFPREYVELMDHYGGGCWGSWLRFPDPHSRGGQELLDWLEQNLDAYRMLHDAFPDECPLPLWPAPGGFLPFADSIDGDVLGWLTDGEPDAWPLIWWPRHTEQGPAMRTGLLDMLLGWIRGSAVDPVFPAPEEGEDPFERAVFEAAR